MIEMSDEKYWKEMTYYDGLLYVSLLDIDGKNDWRMVKNYEELEKYGKSTGSSIWVYDDGDDEDLVYSLVYDKFTVVPVRTI